MTIENQNYEIVPESDNKEYKRSVWDAAIGLQAVDGLKSSEYLLDLARQNIEGSKTYEQVEEDLYKNYEGVASDSGQKEADIVSVRIAKILETGGFILSPELLLSIHEYLFKDILDSKLVGKYREYNITKKEKILFGDTVTYANWTTINILLRNNISNEATYKYSSPLSEENITHLAEFTRDIWQVHPFAEGNTRTTAVFIELYMRSLGVNINNDPFKDYSLFFRNALVRSCYKNEGYGVSPTCKFLIHFYKNVFLNWDYKLDNFDLIMTNQQDSNYE